MQCELMIPAGGGYGPEVRTALESYGFRFGIPNQWGNAPVLDVFYGIGATQVIEIRDLEALLALARQLGGALILSRTTLVDMPFSAETPMWMLRLSFDEC